MSGNLRGDQFTCHILGMDARRAALLRTAALLHRGAFQVVGAEGAAEVHLRGAAARLLDLQGGGAADAVVVTCR